MLQQLSGFKSRHLSKIQNGRHKQRSGQHTLARPKICKKKLNSNSSLTTPVPVLEVKPRFRTYLLGDKGLILTADSSPSLFYNSPSYASPHPFNHSSVLPPLPNRVRQFSASIYFRFPSRTKRNMLNCFIFSIVFVLFQSFFVPFSSTFSCGFTAKWTWGFRFISAKPHFFRFISVVKRISVF